MDRLQALELARTAPRKKTPSLRKAVDAFCRHCIYDEKSGFGTWRQQVTACTATTCPLYKVRPLAEGESHG